tara:strand:+ start:97 stop:543 length:447 start_codon:yes stop_codon:yes gene_type:complete
MPFKGELKDAHNRSRMWIDGKYISFSHPLHKPGRYSSFNEAAFSSFKNLPSAKEGYVYVISNPAWPEWVKVGMAIDAKDRCGSYQTSSPFRDYTLHCSILCSDRRKDEHIAHQHLEVISSDRKGEWFKIPADQAKKSISGILKRQNSP